VGRFLSIDVTAKAAATGAVFLLVREPSDAVQVLWLQGAAASASCILGIASASIRPRGLLPGLGAIGRSLFAQRHGFLFRAAILTYTTANVVVLGWVAAPEEVGLFAAADRSVRLVACFAGPLGQALYPLLARAWRDDPGEAARLAARVAIGAGGIGGALSVSLFVTADAAALLVLGPEFAAAGPVFRLLAPLPVLICLSNILGMQWMFSIGAEAVFVRILALAGLVCLPTGAALGGAAGSVGMAAAATLAEAVVTGGILLHLARSRSLPFGRTMRNRAHAH